MKVNVDGGKYTFVKAADGYSVGILRHGEPWHEQSEATNAIFSAVYELDAARVVLQAARKWFADVAEKSLEFNQMLLREVPSSVEIVRALNAHDSLVGDRVSRRASGPSRR